MIRLESILMKSIEVYFLWEVQDKNNFFGGYLNFENFDIIVNLFNRYQSIFSRYLYRKPLWTYNK